MTSCRLLAAALGVGLVAAVPSTAGPNASTTVPLHVVSGLHGCPRASNPCSTGVNLELELEEWATVYLYLRHYDNVNYMQAAFDWPADWEYEYDFGWCQPGPIPPTSPDGPGPYHGAWGAVFYPCLTGGILRPIVRISLRPVSPGCLEIIEPAYPMGAHLVSCDQEIDPIPPSHRGLVCAGRPGRDVCAGPVPVEASTWGSIKQTYSQ